MRFLVDQCVYQTTIRFLRELGHDLVTAKELGLQRAADAPLLAKAVELSRIFLTRDLDFANLRDYPPASTAGIIILRIRPATADRVHAVLNEFLTLGVSPIGALVIVDRNKYRVRRQ